MSDDLILGLDAFVRSVGINKASPHTLLLGAGASISSGVPSAASCIWEWKRSLFLTKNVGLEAQFAELSLPTIRAKIHRWLDAQRIYPPDTSPEEYGVYIKKCYPIADDRRDYFQEKVRQATPHIGYSLLIKLAEAGIIQSVWTTNFDGLTAKAAANSKALSAIEVGVDCQERLPRKPKKNELICVSLHGDYRYDQLKNTPTELQEQERLLRRELVDHLRHSSLVVVGYSGRDASLMAALEDSYRAPGTGVMYWCGFGDGEIPKPVQQLLDVARTNGRAAYYVQAAGFDDLMLRITLHCLKDDAVDEARALVMAQVPEPVDERADFALVELPTCGIIKSNAFPFTPPGEVYEFDLKDWPTEKVWDYFDNCTRGRRLVAVPFKKAYAFGTIDDICAAFSDRIAGKIERVPINEVDLRYEDGALTALVRSALVQAMAARAGVSTDGKKMLWDGTRSERRKEGASEYLIHQAILVFLRRIAGRSYVILKPTVRIASPTGEDVPRDSERNLKMAILGWQHNKEFNQALESWRARLFTNGTYEFPEDCGSSFKFHVNRAPVLAKVMSSERGRHIHVKDAYRRNIAHAAVELMEPDLVFSNRAGTATVSDPHPVRGIVQNRPYDYALTARKLASSIQLAVICPAKESRKLSDYLQLLHQTLNPGKYEQDYLLRFNGFQDAFAAGLQVPTPGDNLWMTCPEIDQGLDAQRGALQLSRNVTACLSALKASALPNVIVIFIPTRWAKWRSFETESEQFDLHNFVKAFCVPQGLATQFLEEDTLENPLQCRIRWWLSLALYVKSMRTPWVLSSLDSDSAFVGLGVSLDRKAEKGRHVVLGCSHLYNAQGQGLQFRLSKIENPIFRGRRRNAFMSYDDARRVGETIRQLFWESRFTLPERVVIHKFTPFLDDERRGLQAGLNGVKEIDLLEINEDDALRYLSSIPGKDGKFEVDGYPVKRGTLMKLDRDSALLWVHGVSLAIGPRYYQGKRRIPAPLVIRRHSGRSDLSTIGNEILGLSKMNWNSFDLYTQVPATVESSKQIARIGALLERFGAASYDYRLFM